MCANRTATPPVGEICWMSCPCVTKTAPFVKPPNPGETAIYSSQASGCSVLVTRFGSVANKDDTPASVTPITCRFVLPKNGRVNNNLFTVGEYATPIGSTSAGVIVNGVPAPCNRGEKPAAIKAIESKPTEQFVVLRNLLRTSIFIFSLRCVSCAGTLKI